MSDPVIMSIDQIVLDDIYIALNDAYERLQNGRMNIKRCLNYLEKERGYEPPEGYKEHKPDCEMVLHGYSDCTCGLDNN